MPDGEPTLGELYRTFIDFRTETRDELRWQRRLLVGSLATVVVTSIGSSLWAVLAR